jgi:folylpolyglutamate synthase/dihydropteroate synthase
MIVDLAHQFGTPVRTINAVEDALEEAIRLAGEEAIVLVTGSIFVVAGVRETWSIRQASM